MWARSFFKRLDKAVSAAGETLSQARKLRRSFFFCHSIVSTIASLAYGVAR
jgi:hypothetical protein